MGNKDRGKKGFYNWAIVPYDPKVGGFDFDILAQDEYGAFHISLDAIEVYKNLKEYFKGTEHE